MAGLKTKTKTKNNNESIRKLIKRTTIFFAVVIFALKVNSKQQNNLTNNILTDQTQFNSSCDIPTDPECISSMPTIMTSSTPNISQFSYSLFSLLDEYEKANQNNILISPFSIASVLAIALSGATLESDCEKEILETLVISSHTDLPQIAEKVVKSSAENGEKVGFTSVNGIWVKDSIKSSFIESTKKLHSATASILPATYDPIDAYISKETDGLISKMLEGDIDPLTVAILVNAVHFKGSWDVKFDPIETKESDFHKMNGEKVKAMFMKSTRKINIALNVDELAGASLALLDYGYDNAKNKEAPFRAMFLLPPENNDKSMNAVISSLKALSTNSQKNLSQVLQNNLEFTKTELRLPRFKVSWGVQSLKPHLKHMGIKSAFDGHGIFSQISDDPLIHIDDILHKAVMEVTEEGTVAAAATVGIMQTRSLPTPPFPMKFDRPFVMVVLHTPTMTPMFVGRISNPDFIF